MSRKDYVAVAAAIRAELDSVGEKSGSDYYREAIARGIKDTAQSLSSVFAAGNPRFDRQRFLAACGVN
jgi:hypothetical protein